LRATQSAGLLAAGGLFAAVMAHEVIATGVPSHDPVHTSALQPAAAPSPSALPQQGEESELPWTLLGTFAATEPTRSRATLRHRESQETLVVGVGDVIEGHALVVRIERERVVLRDHGSIRELRVVGEHAPSDGSDVATSDASPRAATVAERPLEARLADFELAIRDSTNGQAEVLPELEGDQLVGLHVGAIQDGSRFAEIGIEEDDVITQFNGVALDSPFLALHAVREMLESGRYRVVVRRGDAMMNLDRGWDGAGI
jgi:general secretion pathway protein C